MKKRFKFLHKIILTMILSTAIYFIIFALVENASTSCMIKSFKNECTEYVEEMSNDKQKFYTVSRGTNRPSFTKNSVGAVNPGAPLDVIVKLESTYDIPFVTQFINFFIGGHAALCCDTYNKDGLVLNNNYLIEATYNSAHDDVFVCSKAYWEYISFTERYLVLRVKNLTDDDRAKVLEKAVSMIGDKYNLSFIFNTHKYHYCSDLITKCFRVVNRNTNYDGFATTIFDLVMSGDVEIVGYKEYDRETKISSYYGVDLI